MCAVRWSPLVLLQTSQCVLYNHPRYCCKHHNVHCTLTLGTASNIIMCAIYQSFAYLHTSQCFHSYWKHHNVTQCKVVMHSCTHCNVAQCHLAVSLVWHFQYIIMPLQLQLQSNCCAHCTAFLLLCSVTSWFSYLHWWATGLYFLPANIARGVRALRIVWVGTEVWRGGKSGLVERKQFWIAGVSVSHSTR
jgi:hypothetical protein